MALHITSIQMALFMVLRSMIIILIYNSQHILMEDVSYASLMKVFLQLERFLEGQLYGRACYQNMYTCFPFFSYLLYVYACIHVCTLSFKGIFFRNYLILATLFLACFINIKISQVKNYLLIIQFNVISHIIKILNLLKICQIPHKIKI